MTGKAWQIKNPYREEKREVTQVSQANDLLRRLHERSPTGFAIGLHIQFTTPRYFFQSYSKEWLDAYSAKGFVMNDPIVHWGFSNEGSIRWRDLAQTDPLGVLSGRQIRHVLWHGGFGHARFVPFDCRVFARRSRNDGC